MGTSDFIILPPFGGVCKIGGGSGILKKKVVRLASLFKRQAGALMLGKTPDDNVQDGVHDLETVGTSRRLLDTTQEDL